MSNPKPPKEDLQSRLLGSMVNTAFFSWQSALIIAFGIVMFALNITPAGLPAFFWLIFSLIGVALYVGISVTDPSVQQATLNNLLVERFNPADIKNYGARQRLEQALEYFNAMQKLMATRDAASRAEFQNTLDEVDDWIGHLYQLGKRIDTFDNNDIINRDRMSARREVTQIEKRIKAEPDEVVKDELRNALELKQRQLENLQVLETNIKRADIQMENTLAALGTVYAQLQLISSKDIDKGSAKRLRNEVHDQVMNLQDTIAAIDEVQNFQRSAT